MSQTPQELRKVDFVMSAQEIGSIEELKSTSDYILSSHNLEHIPNPILFLQGCTQALKPDEVISLALPWDRFRPLSSSADWLDDFVSKKTETISQTECLTEFYAL